MDAVCALAWAFFMFGSAKDMFPPHVYRCGFIAASLILTITFVFEFISDIDNGKEL